MPAQSTAAPSASPFQITILEGPLAAQDFGPFGAGAGVISLTGWASPSNTRQKVSFPVEMRSKTTRYAGNEQASQQVMGAFDDDLTIAGVWNDVKIGDGNARYLWDTFDAVCRSGATLQVDWNGVSRRGILKRFTPTPLRAQDVEWEMRFEWRGRVAPSAPPTFSTSTQNPRDALSSLSDSIQGTQSMVQSFQDDPLTRVVGLSDAIVSQIDAAQDQLTTVISQVTQGVAAATTIASIPQNIIERAIGICGNVATQLSQTEDAILNLSMGAYVVRDDALTLLQFQFARLSLLQQSTASREVAANTAASFTGYLFPEVIAEVRAPAGSSLRDIALKFYGDPDLWWVIAKYNGFTGSSVPSLPLGVTDSPLAFRQIAVPRRQNGTLGDLSQAC